MLAKIHEIQFQSRPSQENVSFTEEIRWEDLLTTKMARAMGRTDDALHRAGPSGDVFEASAKSSHENFRNIVCGYTANVNGIGFGRGTIAYQRFHFKGQDELHISVKWRFSTTLKISITDSGKKSCVYRIESHTE